VFCRIAVRLMKAILAVVIFVALFLALDYSTSRADVYVSYTTKECVGVTTYHGVFFDSLGASCENIPSRYTHIWVE